jgi:hypothetical protein
MQIDATRLLCTKYWLAMERSSSRWRKKRKEAMVRKRAEEQYEVE